MKSVEIVDKALAAWKKDGFTGLRRMLLNFRRRLRAERNYRRWIKANKLTEAARNEMTADVAAFDSMPLISVVIPVFNVAEKWLRRCLDSVLDQIYQNWELCIADDASTKPHVRKVLAEYA